MPSAAFTKLRARLAELFQLDAAAELDFGIYRILNCRRTEIATFLDSLEGKVDAILGQAGTDAGAPIRAELEKVEAGLRAGGISEDMIAAAPKVKELREKLAALGAAGQDTVALRDSIFSDLTTFFSRYYKDGDFLSLRRYKADTYAIPYEGEEVKLHWANADQFYIKSAENFRDYTFRLGPAPANPDKPDTRPRVTFKLVEADTDKDNNKPAAGSERHFVYRQTAAQNESQLILDFEHRTLTPSEMGTPDTEDTESDEPRKKKKKIGQEALNKKAIAEILAQFARGTFVELATPVPTKSNPSRSLLEKHLADYTARNTFDYFIHTDLGGFLRRELDFFIKNEIVHLDDLDEAQEPLWTALRARLKALRAIAQKVIRFLAQIEDFQRKLWLKKKFVTVCDYVITVDRLPEELYPAIVACDAQREEWVRLFAIDAIKGDFGRTGYSVPLSVEFLKENKFLPVDTSWLDYQTKWKLAEHAQCQSSVLLRGDNSGGLDFISPKETGNIDACYFDPPYNSGSDGFAFKDSFQSSSWLAMIHERLLRLRRLVREEASVWASIDDREVTNLRWTMNTAFTSTAFVSDIALVNNFKGRQDRDHIATAHEHLLLYGMPEFDSNGFPLTDEQADAYDEEDEEGAKYQLRDLRKRGGNDSREKRPQLYFPLYWNESQKSMSLKRKDKSDVEIFPKRSDGSDGCWRWGVTTVKKNLEIIEGRQVRETGKWNASYRVYLERDGEERTSKPKSVWFGSKYSSDRGIKELRKLLPDVSFIGPKSPELIRDILLHSTSPGDTMLDFFAGSGTTGHAVINLNREDDGDRRYILVEMGEHFDTVLIPRLKKVIYAKDWKDGKPVSRDTGVSHCFKVLRLESYEDTLNNLRLVRTPAQQAALEELDLTAPDAAEDYRLGYMLDLESTGSASLLNVSAFTDPWNYSLEIATGTAGETKPVAVDVVETFNWLLGLTVQGTARSGGVLWVEGTNPQGEKVLVLWRKTASDGSVSAPALNEWCQKMKVSVLDGEYHLIYVNGDHHLDNLRREDQTWKVRLIDEEFPRLMFSE